MSIIKLLIADESEAEAVGNADAPTTTFSGIDAKDVDHVKLAMLALILEGVPLESPSAMEKVEAFALLHESSEEGPWVYRVPDPLISALVSLDEKHRVTVARDWAKIEEFRLDGWDGAEVARMLDSLCGLSLEAQSRGKGVLLWMCL